METFRQKYIKYKNKYLDLKNKNKNKILKGGLLNVDNTFNEITSFGFEFEFGELMPFIGNVNHDRKILVLEPLGYDENSIDDTQNRSVKKFNLPNITVDDLDGEFTLTQDSYDIFNIDNIRKSDLTSMHLCESLTNALDKYQDTFDLENASDGLDYHKIQFNVNKEENLTIGDTEFVCTFRQSNINVFNINKCTQSIIDKLKQYMSDPVSRYVGCVSIKYTHEFLNNDAKPDRIESIEKIAQFDLFEMKLFETKNIYMLVKSDIIFRKENMYDYVRCSPQITLGVPIKSIKNVILKISELEFTETKQYSTLYCMTYHEMLIDNKMIDDIEKFVDYLIGTSIEKLSSDSNNAHDIKLLKENIDNLSNYLFFYYLYSNVDRIDDYEFKEHDTILTIYKNSKSYLPRQHFYEILDKNPELSQCIKIIYKVNFDIILSYRTQYLQYLRQNGSRKQNIFNFDGDIEPLEFSYNFYEMNDIITTQKINNYIREKLQIINENNIQFISMILSHDMKLFIGEKNNEMDNITTFTTRIPYVNNNVLFEYRSLTKKMRNFLEMSGKMNNFNDKLTLNNIEFVLNSYKSEFLLASHLMPEEMLQNYNKLKRDNEQTHIKNSTNLLKIINEEMYRYI